MYKNVLITKVYNNVPPTFKGLNSKGEHVVCFKRVNQMYYATLENLNTLQLENLFEHFAASHEACTANE
jgi:hypothetical protein